MFKRSVRLLIFAFCLFGFALRCPAPLVYRPGEGWTYEPVGGETKWRRLRAEEQLQVAQAAFDKKDYSLALKAARRVVREFKDSDFAPQGQYLVGRCYEGKGQDERAFREYQKVLEKYPKIASYQEILGRQYEIANRYLEGKWFRLWGYIPFFPSMDRTADMFAKIVKNGPYSNVGPQAQLKIGLARVKQSNYPMAVKAYELAADRYHDRSEIAAEALFRAGLAYNKQAETAEYDQSTAAKAIATFSDFKTLNSSDPRAAEADNLIAALKSEQARGNFQTAKFYEKYKKWNGARVYYNEVVLQDPNSPYANEARQRIDELKQRQTPGK